MQSYVTNPSFFRVKTLLSLEISEVDSLARKAVGSLTSFRLLLGRCLLAMRETKGFKKFGCSSEIHYSVLCKWIESSQRSTEGWEIIAQATLKRRGYGVFSGCHF